MLPACRHAATADSRKLAAPQSADAYELKLPASFKVPEGVEFKLDLNDPAWISAKVWAHRSGLSQEQFSEAIAIVAGRDLITTQQVQRAINAEVQKLGPTGPARVDAIRQFYRGLLGGDAAAAQMMSRIFNANDVKLHEALIARFANRGGAPFSNGSREPPNPQGRVTDEEYAGMSMSEKWAYARQFSNGR